MFAGSRIRSILADTGNSDRTPKCGSVIQHGKCAVCSEKFSDYGDVVPDHVSPRGMGGAWRDDHPDNIHAVHWWCNGEKGSSRQ